MSLLSGMRLDARLQPELAARLANQLYRRCRAIDKTHGPYLQMEGRNVLAFNSNDYLGLAQHPEVIRALQSAAAELGVGSTGAHLISGHRREHVMLEEELAAHVRRPRALLFSTGYMANMGVINALTGPDDEIWEDALNHASLLDGGWISRGQMRRYPHADLTALDAALQAPSEGHRLVATDAIFSMDGDVAPLRDLVNVCTQRGADLMIDDAHGLGVLGPDGAGTAVALGLSHQDVPIYMGTLGKALGTFGAFVAGSETLIEFLIQRARTFIYTTATPPALAAASRAALRLAQQESWRREHLTALINRLRSGAAQLGVPLMNSDTPIQPLIVGDSTAALELSQALWADGILVTAIRPPTVPEGTARLRITLSAAHSEEDIDHLLAALDQHLPQALRTPSTASRKIELAQSRHA